MMKLHNDIQHNDTLLNDITTFCMMTFCAMTFSIMTLLNDIRHDDNLQINIQHDEMLLQHNDTLLNDIQHDDISAQGYSTKRMWE